MDKKDIIELQKISDKRGHMVVLETGTSIPFAVKRSYFIYGTKGEEPRGFHAHKALEQVFICVQGSCDVLLDDGYEKKEVHLDNPAQALYVGPSQWRVMHNFSEDCIFLVYASELYDENDYIRDYDQFVEYVRGSVSAQKASI